MHNPGICGVILAVSGETQAPESAAGEQLHERRRELEALIAMLNAGTDLVLVMLGPADEGLAATAWAQAAYAMQLPEGAGEAAALRTALQEVLNRGRDTALVVSLGSPLPTAETVAKMIAAYGAADLDVWAVVPDSELRPAQPALLGRYMIEAMFRHQGWRTAQEVLAANLTHVRRLAEAASIA